jgi:hypothetical protein
MSVPAVLLDVSVNCRVFCAGQLACKWSGRVIIICYVILRLPPIVYLLAASLLFLCLLCLI